MNVEGEMPGVRASELADWNAINWRKVDKTIRRLQVRIVKAQREGRHGKVKALSRILTRSFAAKVLAVKRVTENKGKKTAGVDGVLWNSPVKKAKAVRELRPERYRAKPLRRVYIPKSCLMHSPCRRSCFAAEPRYAGCGLGRAFQMLQPYDGKPSRTVLRGAGAGNSSRLPDRSNADFLLWWGYSALRHPQNVSAPGRKRKVAFGKRALYIMILSSPLSGRQKGSDHESIYARMGVSSSYQRGARDRLLRDDPRA